MWGESLICTAVLYLYYYTWPISPACMRLPFPSLALATMSSDLSLPPPNYAQQGANTSESVQHQIEPQILIIPATDSLRFQQGFLGADGERAAIEGELQVKGTDTFRWRKVSVLIRSLAFRAHADP